MVRTCNFEMENNDLITMATIEKSKESLIDMDVNVEPPSECCVYRVPKNLRKVNEEAYTPQVVSIGPLHHGKKELAHIEKQKIRYKREFNRRITTNAWQEFINFIETNEKRIRNCYAEMPVFQKLDFITMILYDAVFIIEFFLRAFERKDGFLINKIRVRTAIVIDLILLENQLPYFVIKELYQLAVSNLRSNERWYNPSFSKIFVVYFSNLTIRGIPEDVEVKHFTDLARHAMTKKYPESSSAGMSIDLPGSVKLHESGVKFKKSIQEECWLDVRLEKKKPRIPWFEGNELQIPLLPVYDETECIIRNVMALEQCRYPNETHVCNYVNLMDNLINTEEDASLLVEAKILSNFVGDNARIADMFNKLCLQILLSPSCYDDIVKNLEDHYKNRWNHAKATLKRVYFCDLWRGTATIAAIVLLMLTLIQTICSILQVV